MADPWLALGVLRETWARPGPWQLARLALCTHCHLRGHAHHAHLCTYMGVCRRAGENPWLCLDAQGTDTHLLSTYCVPVPLQAHCAHELIGSSWHTMGGGHSNSQFTDETGGRNSPGPHRRQWGARLDPGRQAPEATLLKRPAADARVLDVWMQASPHMCSENIHGCVCTQRLICGALVNMAAWFLRRRGRART